MIRLIKARLRAKTRDFRTEACETSRYGKGKEKQAYKVGIADATIVPHPWSAARNTYLRSVASTGQLDCNLPEATADIS